MEDMIRREEDRPAIEIPTTEIPKTLSETSTIKTEVKRRGRKASVNSEIQNKKEEESLTPFAKEIIGKLGTFCGKVESGVDTIEGVPMALMQDPNGRWLIKFYSSDGSRAFLYLDQIATFYTHSEAEKQESQQQGPRGQRAFIQPGESPDSQMTEQMQDPYYNTHLDEHLPDNQYMRRGASQRAPGTRSSIARPNGVK